MTQDSLSNVDEGVLRIFIIRHGQTSYNICKRLQGHADIDLNETGYNQAKLCGLRLRELPIDYLISSDLVRCENTSKEILKYHPLLKLNKTYNLRERSMGPVEGMYLKDAIEKYGTDYKNLGESRTALVKRLYGEWEAIISKGCKENYKNVVVITHGGVITNFINHLYSDLNYKLSNKIKVEDLKVPYNTSITVVDINKSNTTKGIIQVFGDTAHLGKQLEVKEQLLR
ncbi:hypothetical protein PACTADRAFT_46804 [Pachysolen tannophilus NRRL Y-2460]|uniref:Phosphoglycerate mutase n=1 Tax=Pachysolen tannophilus NRRL Y-2460 TaxID=669874 RepID=A0A1E4TNS8_PACTA|nr:hypothetical protein PACTADRAFT_46804 [Pachysolen tannophilus NRRL Y-2460]